MSVSTDALRSMKAREVRGEEAADSTSAYYPLGPTVMFALGIELEKAIVEFECGNEEKIDD
jgi:hypothetical protein